MAEPTVIVEDLHVVYRVRGADPRPAPARGGADRRTAPVRALTRLRGRPGGAPLKEVHAVRGVTFTAHRGEAIGLIGSNGSGKSTLLRAIAGLQPAASGSVYTGARPTLLGVNAALMNDLTGDRNITLGGLAMGLTRREIQDLRPQIIAFSGINDRDDFASLPMSTYSSGMAARLRFSIASAKQHDVLLIDEALATGDRAFQNRSRDRMAELRAHAGTVFLVSHSNRSIREVCDRVLWLDRGRLRADGPTEEVLKEYEEWA